VARHVARRPAGRVEIHIVAPRLLVCVALFSAVSLSLIHRDPIVAAISSVSILCKRICSSVNFMVSDLTCKNIIHA